MFAGLLAIRKSIRRRRYGRLVGENANGPSLAQQVPPCFMRAYIEKFAFNFRSKQVQDLLHTDLWHVWRFDRREYSVNYDPLPFDRTSEINQWDETRTSVFALNIEDLSRLTGTDIYNIRGKLDEEILLILHTIDGWYRIYSILGIWFFKS